MVTINDQQIPIYMRLFALTATKDNLQTTMYVTFTFSFQKNISRDKKIGYKDSRYPLMCPKSALIWRIIHIQNNSTTPSTPISHAVTPTGRWNNITTTLISRTLKTSVNICGPNMSVSVQSLHTAGAMTLLYAGVDSSIINAIGFWRRN